MIVFTNLLGFWAFLGLPVVILIHFLQKQAETVTVSTLFLLESLEKESVEGRKIDRLRNSVPLWLQLLMVLLATWLLTQPRWIREHSVQKVGLVFDSSASMSAFKTDLLESLPSELSGVGQGATTIELFALDSHLDSPSIYHGTSVRELSESLEDWNPFRSAHDPGPALRVGRSLCGEGGILIFVTDHPVDSPGYRARVLAVGRAVENVGFAGLEIEQSTESPSWQALVKNYGSAPSSGEWFVELDSRLSPGRPLRLEPGETRLLRGQFPGGRDRLTLKLSADDFLQDNIMPVLVPMPKRLSITVDGSGQILAVFQRIVGSLENVVEADSGNPPDLFLEAYNPISPRDSRNVSLIMLSQPQPGRYFMKGRIAATNHPLIEGLNWQGLIARASPGIPPASEDVVLLWQGERPMIFLRETGELRQLIFNFDVPVSNAETLPAFVILVHRFIERIRSEKVAGFSFNGEVNQPLAVAYEPGGERREIRFQGNTIPVSENRGNVITSPTEPGFFEIYQGEQRLVSGAVHFADTREADFSGAGSRSDLSELNGTVAETHTEEDGWWQLWAVLILIALVLSWYFGNRSPEVARA